MIRHNLAYAALAIVYLILAAILFADGNFPHCGCAVAAAIVYALLALPRQERDEDAK